MTAASADSASNARRERRPIGRPTPSPPQPDDAALMALPTRPRKPSPARPRTLGSRRHRGGSFATRQRGARAPPAAGGGPLGAHVRRCEQALVLRRRLLGL